MSGGREKKRERERNEKKNTPWQDKELKSNGLSEAAATS